MKTRIFLAILALLPLAACRQAPADMREAPPATPVRVEKLARGPFQPVLPLLGVVRPGGMAEVTVPAGGRVRYPGRFADGLPSGAQVRAGEVLARISLQDAEASLAEARLRLELATSEMARHQRAFDAGVEPAATLAAFKAEAELARSRLAAAEDRLSRLALRAPVGGLLIVDHRIPPESEIAAGTVLARIASGGPLLVEGHAAAADRDRLRPGLKVRFAAPGALEGALGGGGSGVIREVAPVVEAGGTIRLVAEVTDPTGLPAPGEGIEIQVELEAREQALTVPEEALVLSETGSTVYLVGRDRLGPVAQRRAVETGTRGNGRIEVLRGLSPGDRIVVSGAGLLTDGDPIAEVQEEAVEENRPGAVR